MKHNVLINYLSDNRQSYDAVELAPTCPCCGVALLPTVLHTVCTEYEEEEYNVVYILNYCQKCDACFISTHTFDDELGEGYVFSSFAPINAVNRSFSDAISNLSPTFVEIYNQAFSAEVHGLNHICGIDYRKAIEFLVKDYAIHKFPDSEESILSATLGSCITDYIKDERLATLVRAATWLGNDETHYLRKHPDYTLKELKAFADAFITFIDSDLAYESAKQLISNH